MAQEDSFPRGGNFGLKRAVQHNNKPFNLTKPCQERKPKKLKRTVHQDSSEDDLHSVLNLKGTLEYDRIQNGMLILGCVRRVTNFSLDVELPGLCFVSVPITHISEPLTTFLNKQLEDDGADATTLKDIISVGEFLPVKIIDVITENLKTHIKGSINPADIYAEQNCNLLKKNMLVWSCVNSKTDHGYVMSLGTKNCRAFLPFKNVDQGVDLVIGKPLWCVVHQYDASMSSSLARLSAKVEQIKTAKYAIENLDIIIPGTKINFEIKEFSLHGIYGKFSENFIAYVDENYLEKPLKKVTDYQKGAVLSGYVLFIASTTKVTYLTLRSLEKQYNSNFNKGDVVQAVVCNKAINGINFALPHKQKGFSTNKRLIATLGKNEHIEIMAAINTKYHVGSIHECRILDYNYISQTFICSPEPNIVKKKKNVLADLSPGQLVEVKIVTIKDQGIVVSTGDVRGFVPNLHISNAKYVHNMKKQYKEDQHVNARVLMICDENVLFTLKPKLVEDVECLSRLEDAHVGKKYPGVVAKLTMSGALIVFYSNMKGWLSAGEMGKHISDIPHYFFVGQVVNVYISKIQKTFINLSLFAPKTKSFVPSIGSRFCGKVQSISADGVEINVANSMRKAFIPNAHLSETLSLCEAVKRSFSTGIRLQNLMFIGETNSTLILSRREGIAFLSKRIPSIDDLKVGDIIRCSYEKQFNGGIYVKPVIQNFSDSIFVSKEHVDVELVNSVIHQLLLARVKEITKKKETVLSLKLQEVFDQTVESTLNMYSNYYSELAYLYRHAKKEKWPMCKFNLGDQIQGIVEKVGNQGGCIISLINEDVKAIAAPGLCPITVKEGEMVTGTVIAQDFEKQYIDVCLLPDISRKINPIQDCNLNEEIVFSEATKLLVKDEYIICVMTNPNANKQLIHLPRRLHVNDIRGCSSYHDKKKLKICICGKVKTFLVGMSTSLFMGLDKNSSNYPIISCKEKVEYKDKPLPTRKKYSGSVVSQTELGSVNSEFNINVCESRPEIMIHTADILERNANRHKLESSQKRMNCINYNNSTTNSVILPGVSSFFKMEKTSVADESSEDETHVLVEEKKKKLASADNFNLLKEEEERLSNMENELANPTITPESADNFERLLLSKPNSVEIWAKYIAFHLAGTEVNKARAVAKRALETINVSLTGQKFKIWVVLLNLENLFGTKETFEKCLQDALIFNDPLEVYLRAIELLAKSSKFNEMEEIISIIKSKYKQDMMMWLEVGKTYYQIGNLKKARGCKEKALKSIVDKKSQIIIIVRYAIMEFQYGESDEGSAIFEAILSSDSKKVNIWVTYVDQLIKKDLINEARLILERAVSQQLSLKSAKSLFLKFRKFEESHGTPETVKAVKNKAQYYIDKLSKNSK